MKLIINKKYYTQRHFPKDTVVLIKISKYYVWFRDNRATIKYNRERFIKDFEEI